MDEILIPLIVGPLVVGILFIGLPWLILHYTTKWKSSGSIRREDEDLLDELHALARRLDDRMTSIERIIAADNPDWHRERQLGHEHTIGEERELFARNEDKVRRL